MKRLLTASIAFFVMTIALAFSLMVPAAQADRPRFAPPLPTSVPPGASRFAGIINDDELIFTTNPRILSNGTLIFRNYGDTTNLMTLSQGGVLSVDTISATNFVSVSLGNETTYLTSTNASIVNGTITHVTSTDLTGTLQTASQPNVTNLGTQAYLTATNGTITNGTITYATMTDVTGTLKTANQPNVTNLGTQGYFTATNGTVTNGTITYATMTDITGTLQTASQPNVTNLGTQVYLTATNFTLNGATQKWVIGGTSATYTSGASLSFTAPTTPTWCILSGEELTATKTITSAGFSSDTATRTNPVYWSCGQ